jgi:hypothetical protein
MEQFQMTHLDLEDAINKAWQTSEDLDMFFKHHGDFPTPMTEDEVSNMVYAIKQLHDLRMNNLFEVFKKTHELDEYCTDPEKLSNRARLMKVVEKVNAEIDAEPKKGKKK